MKARFSRIHRANRFATIMLGVILMSMASLAELATGDGAAENFHVLAEMPEPELRTLNFELRTLNPVRRSGFDVGRSTFVSFMGSTERSLPSVNQRPGRLDLNDCVIAVNHDEPACVLHMVGELRDYLKDITGREVLVGQSFEGGGGPFIAVGFKMAEGILDQPLPTDTLGEQGYFLKSLTNGPRGYVVVAGAAARGTRNGLAALLQMIRAEGKRAYVEAPLSVVSKPSFSVRGLHCNGWMFNHPYSFRLWTEREWKRYIDLLGYQQVNLLYLWPFMEIIPLPLSADDQAYLEEVRRVADYAQTEHGMEVWIMQAANRVAKNNLGVADPRLRPYWRPDVQVDMNPADPEHFRIIMESHEALYQIVNNVDGVCTIDTDPGSYRGSPLEDYVRIFNGCRALLDRHNIHGRQAKLINWMWFGWGLEHPSDPKWQASTLQLLKDNLPEPWGLVAGHERYLPVCKEAQALGKTIYLRYGTIEEEPSYPGTNPGLGSVPQMMDIAAGHPELLGVMGNAQCPVLQFPRIYHQLACCWDASRAHRPENEVLRQISTLLYPENADLIADAYSALAGTNVGTLGTIVADLDRRVTEDRLGRPGLFGRKLFPDSTIVAKSLLMQLKLRLALESMGSELRPDSSRAECSRLVEDCLESYLAWDSALGWHRLWGDGSWPLGRFGGEDGFRRSVRCLRRALGDNESVTSFYADLGDRLSRRHDRDYAIRNGTKPMMDAVLAVVEIRPNLATGATLTASALPNPEKYPARFANDCDLSTLYWPGALTWNNEEWIQLAWDRPRELDTVAVYFLKHDSMWNRQIRLQKRVSLDRWEDLATCRPVAEGTYAVARFKLPARVSLDALRIVNLLDLFEIEVR